MADFDQCGWPDDDWDCDEGDEEVRCSNCNGTGEWGGWDKLYGPATPEECPVCSGRGWN